MATCMLHTFNNIMISNAVGWTIAIEVRAIMALLSSLYKHAKSMTNSIEFRLKQPGYQERSNVLTSKYERVIQTVHSGANC